jgi:hypothetical protein
MNEVPGSCSIRRSGLGVTAGGYLASRRSRVRNIDYTDAWGRAGTDCAPRSTSRERRTEISNHLTDVMLKFPAGEARLDAAHSTGRSSRGVK